MTPEQVQFYLSLALDNARAEMQITKKVIAAVPDSGVAYQPHEKSMNALQLMWHIVTAEAWFYGSIVNGSFAMDGEPEVPAGIRTPADVVAWYEANVPPLMEAVSKVPPEKLAEPLDFFGMFHLPRVLYLNFNQSHSVHHRGQLSVYLRGMGAKVPSIYGGSADEPFTPSA